MFFDFLKPGDRLINVSDQGFFLGEFVEWYSLGGESQQYIPIIRRDKDGGKLMTMGMIFPYSDETWSLIVSLGEKKAYDWAKSIYLCCQERAVAFMANFRKRDDGVISVG